jgi:AAA+ superfamily predicted ATPase
MLPQTDLSLQHLQAELARIDLLVQREVRRWQLAGQDPADQFRGLRLSEDHVAALIERPPGTSWGQTVSLGADEARALASAQAQADRRVKALVDAARKQKHDLRLEHLAATFGLDRFDLDVFLICLAPVLDLRYERLYGYLQDDITRKQASVNLALDLLCEPGSQRLLMLARFGDEAPLFRYQLLERVSEPGPVRPSALSQSLVAEEGIVSWLLGTYRPHLELGAAANLRRIEDQGDEAAETLLAGEAWPDVEGALRADREPPILIFYGQDRAGQNAAARLAAARLERPLLEVDLASATSAERPGLRVLALALRDARLAGAVPYLTGWDAGLANAGGPAPAMLGQLCAFPGLAIVAGEAAWLPSGIERERELLRLEFGIPAYAQRQALWRHFVDVDDEDGVTLEGLDALAGQFLLTTDQIRDAVATARDIAAQRGNPLEDADLFLAARSHSNPNLAGLARKITPRYKWEDIILPPDQIEQLKEIVSTVRGRPMVLETWGVGVKLAASAGITILFAGPPGTGKTMAAEVIARELGLDLYKVDLSTIISKYIGETEKNLERIFAEAQSSNAILFFDEADAIFGKRSEVKDAHDRYANIEVSYLLQRMEAYDGVTILATNLRANLDEAFTRRLQFAVDFPFPDEMHRLRIWETLFPAEVPRAKNLDLGVMARRFKLAGGNIRNIIVSSAYLAAADGGQVSMNHLLHSTRRELQKMGRLVKEKDLVHE